MTTDHPYSLHPLIPKEKMMKLLTGVYGGKNAKIGHAEHA